MYSNSNVAIALIVQATLGILVAYFFGRKRVMGIAFSFLFCLFFTPIIGFIITITSPKQTLNKREKNKISTIFGFVLLVIYGSDLFRSLNNVPSGYNSIEGIFLSLGLVVGGIYLILAGQGRSFGIVFPSKKAD